MLKPCANLLADNSGPAARFTFNNKSGKDEISKNNFKAVGITFVKDRFGNADNAIHIFGNEYSYVNLGNYPAIKPKAGSISMWLKVDREVWTGKGYKANPILLTKSKKEDDFYEAYGIYYNLESQKIVVCSSRDSLKQVVIASEEKNKLFEWRHAVVTYDSLFFCLYLDGSLQRKAIKNFDTKFLLSDSVLVGITGNKKNERYFEGDVDDIEFYDHVLTPYEVSDLYHSPNPNNTQVFLERSLAGLGILALVFLLYVGIRYQVTLRMKKEKQKLELRNTLLETELRINRALMNPHFVFNSLNALQNFILKNENDRANDYLVKFSKLVRKLLESNSTDTIPLAFEVDLLSRYLEIEDLRFEENIRHSIEVKDIPFPSATHIPIMMIQPFVENAIWHGLLKKPGEKILKITFSLFESKYVQCIIEDNGTGRKNTGKDVLEKKSVATVFIQQRLELLNEIHGLNCGLSIEDKPNSNGTIVTITLPILNKQNAVSGNNH